MLHRTDPNDPRPALAGNPLVTSVLRENVRVADGRATIGLWGGWHSLLAEIPAFGKVLAISRNSHAVLGSIAEYPDVDFVPCGRCDCAVDGSLEFDFTSWQRAVAIVEARLGGWLYAIEFSDPCGEVIHKICLTENSNFEAFRCWVELNQTVAGIPPGCSNSRHSSWLENSPVLGVCNAKSLRIGALRVFLQIAAAERSAFRAIVGNDDAVQAAQVIPAIFSQNGQWIFTGDANCGIHVRVGRLAEVFLLHSVGEFLSLKACDPEGRLVCALLYATMTGNARECAERTAALLSKAGLPVRLHDLAQYDARSLLKETTALLPISTWGDGDPPDDGVNFFDYIRSLGLSSLCNLRFAVFALGDTGYDKFCQCGRDLDRMLEERGATRLLDRVDNDIDFEDALAKWHDALVAILQDTVAA